jgi:hypothetical protein
LTRGGIYVQILQHDLYGAILTYDATIRL